MNPFINPPQKMPFIFRIIAWMTEKKTGLELLPVKILAWYPKTAIGSGILESLVAHGKKDLNKRILKLVRIQTSFFISCPFCIDMNSFEYEKYNITEAEVETLRTSAGLETIVSFSEKEKIALEYARQISATPLSFSTGLVEKLKNHFTEREIVILASTAAQVNYWGRLLQALGIPPAGFTLECRIPKEKA